ncbi:MAG: hypothetical protein LQ342_000151 [Letrouitia transgressa]|nr:MAG: hypothetical protein LQ342_000151 [Letrouitia transgressa]
MANNHHDGHEGVNPQAAADLLRQAMLQNQSYDEGHDLISSGTATPSGVVTPRPDPVDKRLPGIVHTYFGQVGAMFSSHSHQMGHSPALVTAVEGAATHRQNPNGKSNALPTAPTSPSEKGDPRENHYPSLLEPEGTVPLQGTIQIPGDKATPYLTPPISSPGSLSDNNNGASSPSNISRNRPVTRYPSTVPSTPARHPHHISALSALTSNLELAKLTDDVATLPCTKSTPPRTPRALSSDGSERPKKRVPTSSPSQETFRANDSFSDADSVNSHKIHTSAQSSPPVGPPKGKLSVRISEGRGLKPSYDPYAVCVFEYNEAVARNPKQEERNTEKDEGKIGDFGLGGATMYRSRSDMGRSMAIPMKSRQSSTTSLSDQKHFKAGRQVTNPKWDHEAMFDVLSNKSDIDVYIYDKSNHEAFLGHTRVSPNVSEESSKLEGWYKLEARDPEEDRVSGEIHLEICFHKTDKKHFGPEDFQILKLVGKGTFGQVYLVRKKDTQRLYAMKVLSKKVIVQKKEVAHTLGERNILVRTAVAESPFIVGLKFSFQTATDLYLVTSYMSGGELFWHLQKAGRFNEGRAKFYIAELILALQHLHKYDIVYRDLKPENILLDANGHIALCDFGLSKANLTKDDTTNTFCGTTEYLAPEVLLDEQGYTTMVDFWSLGVLVFEMCCGWSPFYADDTQQMYKNIAFGKVRFPRDALSTEGRNFVKGLLNRNPKHRLGAINDAEDLKAHPFFKDMDWSALANKTIVPPFKPQLKSVLDTSNFDPEFTNALENSSSLNARAAALTSGAIPASTPLSPGMQANFKGFTFVDESTMDEQFRASDTVDMDEGTDNENDGWEHTASSQRERGDRMSGIIKTGDSEDGVFNVSHFDV